MTERKNIISFQGSPMTLLGNEIKIKDKAPDVTLINNDMKPVKISDYRGNNLIIATVPSLDTPVCDMETRRFNSEASKLDKNVQILTISMDLPFAQKRWCGQAGVDHVTTLSDYNGSTFGKEYGVLIKELNLLARTIFILDKEGIVRYTQIVKEITSEPNYEEVLNEIKKLG